VIEDLLTRPATIVHRSQTGAADEDNAPTWEETSRTSTSVYLQQRAASEVLDDRNVQIGDQIAIFPAGVTIDGSDRVEIDGRTFEVVGAPASVQRPGTGEHHLTARLQEVSG